MEERVWEIQGSANIMWEEMANGIQKLAKEVLSELKGFSLKDKESWKQNDNVQKKIKYKRECFKLLQFDNNIKNWEKYRSARRETKKVVSEARSKAFKGFYQPL